MTKKIIFILSLITIPVLVFIFVSTLKERKFIQTCKQLNGKQLTLENLKKLDGKVYASISRTDDKKYTSNQIGNSIGLYTLDPKFIDQYKESFSNTLDDKITHIHVYNKSFDITRGKLDDDWMCNIRLDQNSKTIRTRPYYLAD